MKVLLKLDGRTASGGAPLVMHNERLADPLDEFVRAIAEITAKRKKAEADHEEVGRLEFFGGLYTEPLIAGPGDLNGQRPCLPAWNILRCLQDGASIHKRGQDVLRGVHPIDLTVPLIYEGPATAKELWLSPEFRLRKSVGIQRRRVPRTRPMFVNWQAELAVEVNPTVFDLRVLQKCWADAGVLRGLGEMRPVYGRFKATAEEAK
jgi:hypothetical protein